MQKFVLEIRCEDGKEYPPNTLYQICCGIMHYIQKFSPEINFFSQPTFASFKKTLDGEMKCLKANGAGIHIKRAQPHDMQEEEQLWEKGTLAKLHHKLYLTLCYSCVAYILPFVYSSHHHLAHSIYCSHIKNTN